MTYPCTQEVYINDLPVYTRYVHQWPTSVHKESKWMTYPCTQEVYINYLLVYTRSLCHWPTRVQKSLHQWPTRVHKESTSMTYRVHIESPRRNCTAQTTRQTKGFQRRRRGNVSRIPEKTVSTPADWKRETDLMFEWRLCVIVNWKHTQNRAAFK